jgi:S-adenosylmethionine:tRNA ribosyltransferase-isomerase
MKTSDFNYDLPPELIAQHPVEPRDSSRLMVINRSTGTIEHRKFHEITGYLNRGDFLVFNDSRVIPARLKGKRLESGGKVEILLLRRLETDTWEALVKPAKRLQPGSVVEINPGIRAEIIANRDDGIRVVHFPDESRLMAAGEMPLPPYIHEPLKDPERYQTVYSHTPGSAAAPTAGLHFTPALLNDIKSRGIRCVFTTLHVGLDTFRPVTAEDPRHHTIHREYGIVDKETADTVSSAKKEGRRVICVGTTSVRLTEQAASVSQNQPLDAFDGWADLFILPGHRFRIADAMVTNFHLPRSSLLMLVSAFAGKAAIDAAYREAIARRYRFYSFGDAMLIL